MKKRRMPLKREDGVGTLEYERQGLEHRPMMIPIPSSIKESFHFFPPDLIPIDVSIEW